MKNNMKTMFSLVLLLVGISFGGGLCADYTEYYADKYCNVSFNVDNDSKTNLTCIVFQKEVEFININV